MKRGGGQSRAINLVLDKFNGDYVTWFDSDDFMTLDSIEKRVRFLEDNPQYDFCCCQLIYVSENDLRVPLKIQQRIPPPGQDNLFEDLIYEQNILYANAWLVRREAFFRAHPTKKIFESRQGQNWQLLLPLAYRCKLGYVNEPLGVCVRREDSHSHQKRDARQAVQRNLDFLELLTHTIKDLHVPNEAYLLEYINIKYYHRNLVLGIKHNDTTIIEECLRFSSDTGLNIFGVDAFDVATLLNNYILPVIDIKKILR